MKLLYIDLFCGAGGTSTGVEMATFNGDKCAKVIACVNHDSNAISSHAANHPNALHFTEDIRTLKLSPLIEHTERLRLLYPDAYLVLWASLECTNFSKAKGGLPRNADSRTLAEHLFRYIEALNPDYIQIENVEEFMSWGDMDENGHPISKDKGKSYVRWVNNVCKYGYYFDWRILNAADYGAFTSRKRFFGIFAKHSLPIAFPKATHSKYSHDYNHNLFREDVIKPWKSVRCCLDLHNEGDSIFGRKKPLVEKTLQRIYAGLIKFVAGGKDAFIVKYNSMNNKSGKYIAPGIDEPCPTVATQNRLGIAKVRYFRNYYDAVSTNNIVVKKPWIMNTNYGNIGSSIDDPSQTITANRKFHYLMNPQFDCKGCSIDKPCFTLIARMDKMPPYLISTKEGFGIEIYKTDSPTTIQIKEFMAMYGIYDIRMRMLSITELKRIMGFPDNYTLIGTQAEQKKFIGNAVEVNMARVLCEAIYEKLNQK